MRFSEVANTIHETLKYTINVNKDILKMKNIFSSKITSALQMDPDIKILPDPRKISMEEFCGKSRMSKATAVMKKYEIGHNLKTIQVRDPYFQG